MTSAVLYRWRIKPGRVDEFRDAWTEGTNRIHKRCGSYGANLHIADDGLVWSYACWPSEEARQSCFAEHDWFAQDCFKTMQDCTAERFDEVRMDLVSDALTARETPYEVPVLTTERLVLRPMAFEDAEPLLPALTDPDNLTYWSSAPVKTLEEARDYLAWNIHGAGGECFVLAETATPKNALGWVILMDRKAEIAEIGWMLRPDAQGRGLAHEAAARVMKYGFETRNLRRIYADTDPDNVGSRRLMEKLGMQLEGRARASWKTHIGVRDSLIYARLATD